MQNEILSFDLNSENYLFRLSPTTTTEDWGLQYYDSESGEYRPVPQGTQLNVVFNLGDIPGISENARRALISKQQAVFIVEMEDCADSDWRFWQSGISLSCEQDSQDYQLTTDIENQGKTLVLTIKNVLNGVASAAGKFDDIDFRFVAVRLNNSAGALNEIFYSQDPRIGVRRDKPA
ncbi:MULTISPECIES: hypothetical protein [unclassified Pseudoalteromonas]|uniref:hypothetical protein n=1 Tax=unclassified Pseudoalteromonas TaxID=194690 RepID=UPI002096DCB2|nr:hypothetical protein [Pseudoalteromonas sp. XMcav2-N]MCO7188614.1 hypothetical protein [Pseudoalteromonas sp. XMcav2-N]